MEADTLSRPTWVVPTPESTQTVWVKAPSGSQDCSRAAVGPVVAWPSPPSVEAQQIYAVGDVAPSAVDLVVAQQEWPELVDIVQFFTHARPRVYTERLAARRCVYWEFSAHRAAEAAQGSF